MKLVQAATFSRSTIFPTLDTPLTDLLWPVVKMVFGNTSGPGRTAKGVGSAGPTLGRLIPGLLPRHPFMSYYRWTPLVLDISKICMDFGPYGSFSSSDVPILVGQQNSWNTLVISTYLLYIELNVGMLAVNICILWPPTPPHTLSFVHPWAKEKELNPSDNSKNSSAITARE
jgi:hypothetical protein